MRPEAAALPRNGGAGNHPLRSFLAPGGGSPIHARAAAPVRRPGLLTSHDELWIARIGGPTP